jgi:hypothetical protein
MRNDIFTADGEILAYSRYVPAASLNRRVLSLRGAGPADRERIGYLAEHLVSRGFSAFCFDFSGHGKSTAKLQQSSLVRRAVQTKAAIEFMPQFPTVLIGTSYGRPRRIEHRLSHKSEVSHYFAWRFTETTASMCHSISRRAAGSRQVSRTLRFGPT